MDAAALWVDAAVAEVWLLVVAADDDVLSGVDDSVADLGESVTKAVGTALCPGAYMSGKLGSSGGS